MAEARPDPDQLLERIKAEEARARRGHLRIFFGGSAGVGKTYAMLEAARSLQSSGTDVLVGYVEPHGRVETERLLAGLPRLPTLPVRYRGILPDLFKEGKGVVAQGRLGSDMRFVAEEVLAKHDENYMPPDAAYALKRAAAAPQEGGRK